MHEAGPDNTRQRRTCISISQSTVEVFMTNIDLEATSGKEFGGRVDDGTHGNIRVQKPDMTF